MDNRDSSLVAFLFGAIVGAAVALLYAPKTGKETRAHLKRITEDFVEDAGEKGMEFTRTDYMDVFEKKPSKGTVQNDLLMMVKLGLSEKYGDGPSTKYKVK